MIKSLKTEKNYKQDRRIVVTLDAGGTNFVFGAMQGCEFITHPLRIPANAHDLDLCLSAIIEGFAEIISGLDVPPVAISFAFPGPADYPNGIIAGHLPNFPSFREGVALGPFIKQKFRIPVYINNDGNLFAYGEALGGTLPEINRQIELTGSDKQYRNLTGVTFGTGFGCGVVINGQLLLGDNASGGDIWCFRNSLYPEYIVEESVSIRAVKRVYRELSADNRELTPQNIFDIAEGLIDGNTEAAKKSFYEMGQAAGDALSMVATIVDGTIVIGGGLTGASKYIIPAICKEMQSNIKMMNGESFCRMQTEVFNLDDEKSFSQFCKTKSVPIKIFGSDRFAQYNPDKRIGIATSKLGAEKAISVGAYIFALDSIDKTN